MSENADIAHVIHGILPLWCWLDYTIGGMSLQAGESSILAEGERKDAPRAVKRGAERDRKFRSDSKSESVKFEKALPFRSYFRYDIIYIKYP